MPTGSHDTVIKSRHFYIALVQTDNHNIIEIRPQREIIANTTPPVGVPEGELEEINIRWTFSTMLSCSAESEQTRLVPMSELQGLTSDTIFDNRERIGGNFRGVESSPLSPSFKWNFTPRYIWSSPQSLPKGSHESRDENSKKILHSILQSDSNSLDSTLENVHPEARGLPDVSKRRKRTSSLPQTFDVFASCKLVDASFRRIISGGARALPGVNSVKKSFGPNLANIAPALFSPGYLKVRNISQV